MHEGDHVFDGVLGGHLFGDGSLIVVKQFHGVFPFLIVIFDGVRIVGETLLQGLVERQALRNLVDEHWNGLAGLVTPRLLAKPIGVLGAIDIPVVVEVLLHLLHLFACRIFSVLLHLGVDGGVNLQAGAIQVITVLLTPRPQVICDGLTEIHGLSVVVFLNLELEDNGYLLERVAFLAREAALSAHIVKHCVASGETVLRICLGIIKGSGFEHAH